MKEGKPQRKIGDRELTDVEHDRYQEATGRIANPRLDELVQTGDWRAMSREDRQEAVGDLMKDARKEAPTALFGAPAKPSRRGRGSLPPLPPGFKVDDLPPLRRR